MVARDIVLCTDPTGWHNFVSRFFMFLSFESMIWLSQQHGSNRVMLGVLSQEFGGRPGSTASQVSFRDVPGRHIYVDPGTRLTMNNYTTQQVNCGGSLDGSPYLT
jgi:hypothetical protein